MSLVVLRTLRPSGTSIESPAARTRTATEGLGAPSEATLGRIEAELRSRPGWTRGIPVVGCVDEGTVFAYYDRSEDAVVVHAIVEEYVEEDLLRRLPEHRVVEHHPPFPDYRSRHSIPPFSLLEWESGRYVPHSRLDLGRPMGWIHSWRLELAEAIPVAIDAWAAGQGYRDNGCIVERGRVLRPEYMKGTKDDPAYARQTGNDLVYYYLDHHDTVVDLASSADMLAEGLKPTSDGRWWMKRRPRHKYERLLQRTAGIVDTLVMSVRDGEAPTRPPLSRWTGHESIPEDLVPVFSRLEASGRLPIHHLAIQTCTEPTRHLPPKSEAGRIQLSLPTLRAAFAELEGFGLVDRLASSAGRHPQLGVPLRDKPLPSRLLGKRSIWHATTGPNSAPEALRRLEGIVERGAIYGGAERRWRGIIVRTMSPKGDLVSGVDRGVAATVSERPYTRTRIAFRLRPSVLDRRSWWVAARDYGWEDDPWASYSGYGAGLGQSHIYGPMPNRGARRHLRSLDPKTKNEIFFPHLVPIEDVEAVVCTVGVYHAAAKILETLPARIRPAIELMP